MVTLTQLLASRDRRAQHQKDLLGTHPGKSLLCLTVQLPGSEKRNDLSLRIARAAVDAVRGSFPVDEAELLDLETGYEGYFILSLDPVVAKRQACHIEDTHPLGRLMDLDVLSGDNALLTDRLALGLPPRRCLICDRPARYCMRARTHGQEELLARIEQMVHDYGS